MTQKPIQDSELVEARDVHRATHNWINTMRISGLSDAVIVTGAMQALIEISLMSAGAPKTAKWLRSQARMTEKTGDELLTALRGG